MAVRFSLLFPDEGVREYSVWTPPYGVFTDEETEIEMPQTPDSPYPATLSGLSFTSELVFRSENNDFIVESFLGRITSSSPTIELTGEHAGLSSRIYSMSRTDLTKTGALLTTFRLIGDDESIGFPYMYYEYTTRKDDPGTHYLTYDNSAYEINALAFDPALGITHYDSAVLIEDFYNTKTWTADIEVYGEGSVSLSDGAMPYNLSARWRDANIVAEGDGAYPWPENWKIENGQIGLNPDKNGNDTFTLSATESWRLLSVKIVDLAVDPKVSSLYDARTVPEMQTGTMEDCPYDCIIPNGEDIQYSPMRTVIFFVFGQQWGSGEKTAYPISLHPYTNRMIDGHPAIIPTIPIAPPYVFTNSMTSFDLDNPEQFIPKFAAGGGSRELHGYYMACTTAFLGGAAIVALLAITKGKPFPENPTSDDLSDSIFPIRWYGPYKPSYQYVWYNIWYVINKEDVFVENTDAYDPLKKFAVYWMRDTGSGVVKTYICSFTEFGVFGYNYYAQEYHENNLGMEGNVEWISFGGQNAIVGQSPRLVDPGAESLVSYLTSLFNKYNQADSKKERAEILAKYEAAIKDVLFALSLQRPNIPKKIENWVYPETEEPRKIPVPCNKFDLLELEHFNFYESPDGGYTLVPYSYEPPSPEDPFPGAFYRKWLSLYKSATDAAFAIFIVSYHKKTNQLVRNNTDKPVDPTQCGKHLLRNDTERDILEFLDGSIRTFGKDAIYRKG